MHPTESQLSAEFIRHFRDESGGGDTAAVPIGDAEVFFQGMVDLPLMLLPLAAAVWSAAYSEGVADAARQGGAGASRENPYGEPATLPSEDEASVLLAYDEGPLDE